MIERNWKRAVRQKSSRCTAKTVICTVEVRIIANVRKIQGLETAVKTACKELGDEFADNIYDKYGKQVNCNFVDSALTERP